MRLSEMKQVSWGKEDNDEIEENRRDIIHSIFLGDRQVWQKKDIIQSSNNDIDISNKIITTWRIIKDFEIANLTQETSIVGTIDWGDGDLTENWRSGNIYAHSYMTEAEYDITFICTKYRSNANIARIEETGLHGITGNELIGVTFGKVPFSLNKMGQPGVGIFENVTTLKTVTLPRGVTFIPPRAFYNTSIEELIFPKNKGEAIIRIDDKAFVCNTMKKITVSSSVTFIGEKALGYGTDDYLVPNLEYYCVRNTVGDDYARNNGITPIYFVEEN